MKYFFALILTALLAFVMGLYLPWWSVALAAFIVAFLVHQKAYMAFITGFLAVFLLWGGLAFYIDSANGHLLASKVGELLGVGNKAILVIIITASIGGLVSGVAALSGSLFRKIFLQSTATKNV